MPTARRLSLEALAVLDAIERNGSFAGAANEMHRVPSAITYLIKKLEDDLGVSLFDRAGHRAQLTEIGALLLSEGRHLLASATAVEARIRRLASGWESELIIAISDLFPTESFHPLLAAFYASGAPTRLRLSSEVLGGVWDALHSGRADIAIGVALDAPPPAGFALEPLADVEFLLAVAPTHPLATRPEPLSELDLLPYRVVAVADSSRNLPPRSAGILTGQDVLTVARMRDKLEAQAAGLGIGYVPRALACPWLADGRLLEKRTLTPPPTARLGLGWRPRDSGRATVWFIEALRAHSPLTSSAASEENANAVGTD